MNATEKARRTRRDFFKEVGSWISALLLAVVIALPIKAYGFELIRVDGSSMEDTLQNQEIMFVTKFDYLWQEPMRFDVVICGYPNRTENFVKRIVGLPGDRLSIADGRLTVNGVTYPEEYLTYRPNYTLPEITVPENEYYVLGDHRSNSNDSHIIGPLPRALIRGRVRAVLYPFSTARCLEDAMK
ncbi:MAG: signal peptidase I [Eubacteriales bacterium]|nr:signal peptidase I [Eubacteriales bacterium]